MAVQKHQLDYQKGLHLHLDSILAWRSQADEITMDDRAMTSGVQEMFRCLATSNVGPIQRVVTSSLSQV
jgi:hypothetical protein